MPRMLRRLAAIAVLIGAWALVGSDRAPLPLTVAAAEAGQTGWDGSLGRAGEKPPHDLSALRVFTKVILYVKDNYVDPKRVRPKEMMIAALEYVEKSVPDVLVEGNAEAGTLKLNVNGQSRDFDIRHVDSLWKMSFALKDVFDFIAKNMRPVEDTRDIEYAAVNGMLSTLDPHSVLLRPELYREMKMSTKGEFGGLGFVIQMREGNLTVVKVLPKTPAARAGIQKDDQIKRIGEESTVNMDLNEAVSKLRGAVDSKVSITVDRKGWEKARTMTLARAMIAIESVQHKLLSENVGYVRLKNFQGNTTQDLQKALADMRREAQARGGGMKGLVLDLRGNPGGLLEQATQVSDTFISDGVLVSTVGLSDKYREDKRAHATEGEESYPIAVLVNAGSASASEIVAGALKNLDRAVIIGRQTFGKGSVQVLYDFPDDSALKLTIAKYLTPGDVSIQEVGVVPDIQLVPTRVTPQQIDVWAPRKTMGEADLDQHFGNPSGGPVAKKRDEALERSEKPLETVKYLKVDPKTRDAAAKAQLKDEGKSPALAGSEKAPVKGGPSPLLDSEPGAPGEDLDDQLDAESQDEVKEDFEVLFARDYVLKAPFGNRQKMLQAGKAFVEAQRREQEKQIQQAVTELGVDWSAGPRPAQVSLASTLTPPASALNRAGDTLVMELTAENRGTQPLKRVRAWTESDNPLLDRREFVFGALAPGQKRSWKVEVKLPKDLTARRDDVTVKFFDDQGELGQPLVSELAFGELPRPSFAFNWQIVDGCSACNGDGVAQRGETVSVVLDVSNVGKGPALDAFASIKNAGDPSIFIEKGRFKLGELKPGETRTARFELEVKKGFKGDEFPLKLAVIDEPLEEFVADKLEVPVADAAAVALQPAKGSVRLGDKAELFAAPRPDARVVAQAARNAVLAQTGRGGGWVRLALEDGRFAFAREKDVKDARAAKPAPARGVTLLARHAPPTIQLEADGTKGGVVAPGERFSLSGTVSDPDGLLDMYVLVNDQKVFFKAVDPKGAEPRTLHFTTEFPLKEGNNNVLVVARQDTDFASRQMLVIRRRPEALAQKLAAQQPATRAQ